VKKVKHTKRPRAVQLENGVLPKGWRIVKLGDVAESRLGKMLDKQKNKGKPQPYLRNPNVQWFHVDVSDLREMPFEDDEDEKYGLQEGDVVICEGGEAGRAAIWDGAIPRMKIQKAIHRVRPTKDLFNRYLVYQLMADYHSGRLADYYTGTTIKHLTGQDLALYEFPLPPLAEQKRIAAILDKADAIRRKRQQAIQLTDQFLRSTFLDMFGDPGKNPKGWPINRLDQIADVNRGKFTPRPRNDPRYYGGPHPFIQTGELAKCDGILRTWSQTLNSEGIKVSRQFPKGTIAIAIAANIGDTAILGFDAYATDSVVGIQVHPSNATAEYVEFWFRFQQAKLKSQAPETAQKNINLQVLRPLAVPTPPLAIQERFSDCFNRVEQMRESCRKGASGLDTLFHALVQRAFRGEL
jgi:type I restriction enzyme, S subunit